MGNDLLEFYEEQLTVMENSRHQGDFEEWLETLTFHDIRRLKSNILEMLRIADKDRQDIHEIQLSTSGSNHSLWSKFYELGERYDYEIKHLKSMLSMVDDYNANYN